MDRRTVLGGLGGAAVLTAVSATGASAAVSRSAIVRKLAAALAREYQDEAMGRRLSDALLSRLAAGKYQAAEADGALATRLTSDLRAVANDKHLGVVHGKDLKETEITKDAGFVQNVNFGLQVVQRLAGNVGLIELTFFPDMSFGDALFGRYAAAMTLVSGTRALIVDVRKHIGGEPAAIAYFVSYFFDRPPFLLNEIRNRRKLADMYYTREPLGPRYGEHRPVFVVTSSRTFSGGEEVAYDLQALKRASVVGETTGGGANPLEPFELGGGFIALIPTGRAVNPITHANWEGAGVKPDVPKPAADALTAAHRLALEASLAQAPAEADRDVIKRALNSLSAG